MPTATDRDFLDMRVSDVRRVVHAGQDHHVVLLQEAASGRRLPIWIGHEHALELALRLLGHDSQLPRPLSSDLTAHLVQALGGSARGSHRPPQPGTYYAVIVVDGPHGTIEVDARPSDALALALVVGAPVRADRAVLETPSPTRPWQKHSPRSTASAPPAPKPSSMSWPRKPSARTHPSLPPPDPASRHGGRTALATVTEAAERVALGDAHA